MDRSDIAQAAATDFVSLLGLRETQKFEAKQQWPDFSVAMGRWEFAKDVAAMANGGGGLIIFGVSTQKLPAQQADVTAAIHPIDPTMVNVRAANGILLEHVVPQLRDVQIEFVEGGSTRPKGLVVIEVPPQKSKVILCKAIEGNDALKEYLFGYSERDGDGTRNWSREEIVKMIKTGTDPVSVRLEAMEQILSSLQQERIAARTPVVDDTLLEARIAEVLSDE